MLPDNLLFHHRRLPLWPSPENAAITISSFPFLARTIVIYYMTDGVQEAIGVHEAIA